MIMNLIVLILQLICLSPFRSFVLNKLHQPWWIKNIRDTYRRDTDFTGPDSYLNTVPDTSIRIIWLPYLGQLPFMMMDVPGNLQFIEYIPGEMFAIKAKEDMELVKAWSTWKEGTAAAFLGRRFDSFEKMQANNYEWQQIFMNKLLSVAIQPMPPQSRNLKSSKISLRHILQPKLAII